MFPFDDVIMFDVNCDMFTSDCDAIDDVIVKIMFGFDIICYIDYDSVVTLKLPSSCKKIQNGMPNVVLGDF